MYIINSFLPSIQPLAATLTLSSAMKSKSTSQVLTLCKQFPLLAGAALVLVGGSLARALHAQRHAGAFLRRHPGPGGVEGHHHVLLVAVGGLGESADQ